MASWSNHRSVRVSREPPHLRALAATQRACRRHPPDPATRDGRRGIIYDVPSPTGLAANGANRSGAQETPQPTPRAPVALRGYGDDAELVVALRRGEDRARVILVERFEPLVERLVAGVLGIDGEIDDVVQDVFVGVLEGIRGLKDSSALRSWIATLAVFTARGRIRRRRRWRWIRFVAPEDVPEVPVPGPQPESHESVRATYQILDAFPSDERLAFSLRFISEMQLTEVADACKVSLATVKRRLARAEKRFVEAARNHPALQDRIERSSRWGEP
jgi:RNA polymerase sigma-70 factor, ECF subfamily